MRHDSLISMNITYNDSILNNKFPILFYWNGKNDPVEEICSNVSIINFLNKTVSTPEMYDSGEINFVTYKFDEVFEQYDEKTLRIKDYFTLDNLSENIVQQMIVTILNDMYFKVFSEYYNGDEDDFKEKTNAIISAIRSHYTKEISNETILNYVRKTYKDHSLEYDNKIESKNEEILINTLKEVI